MNSAFHTEITPADRRKLAEKLGKDEQYLYQCLTGRRDMNPAEALRIEIESAGVLTRQMLCQKSWRGIWPDLLHHPITHQPATQAAGQGA